MSGSPSSSPSGEKEEKKKNFWRLSLKKNSNRSRASSLNTSVEIAPDESTWHVVVCGPQAGKSTLIHRLLENKFLENDDPTIEDCYKKKLDVLGKPYDFEILDTSGNDCHEGLQEKWWIWGDIFVLVYSIAQKESFALLELFVEKIRKVRAGKKLSIDVPLILIGTQADMEEKRQVPTEEGEKFCSRIKGSGFLECSSKTGQNVEHLLELIVKSQRKSFVNRKSEWNEFKMDHSANEELTISEPSKPIGTPTSGRSRESSLSNSNQAEKLLVVKEQVNVLNEKIIELSRSKTLAHEKGNFADVENITQLITSLHNERHNLEEKILTLQDLVRAEAAKKAELTDSSQSNNESPESPSKPAEESPSQSQSSPPTPAQETPVHSRSPSVSSNAPSLPSVPKPVVAPKKPSPYYATKAKDLHNQIKKYKESVKFFRSNGETEEAEKIELLILQLQSKMDKVATKLRIARQAEFTPPQYTEKHEKAAKVIQSGLKLYSSRLAYKSRVKMHKKRTNIVRELVDTEETYVASMRAIVDLFLKPLREKSAGSNPVMNMLDIKNVFSVIELIYEANSRLLQALKEAIAGWSPSKKIGAVLLEWIPILSMYTTYVNNYDQAVEKVKEYNKNSAFIHFVEAQHLKKDLLESLLITPVQRIPRYMLLLTDLLNNTWKDHTDFDNIALALDKIKAVATMMNERKREAEKTYKVYEIQNSLKGNPPNLLEPGRTFVREGPLGLMVPKKKQPEDRHVILFNDIIVIAKKTASKKGKGGTIKIEKEFQEMLSFKRADVINHEDTESIKHGFEIITPKTGLWLCAETLELKNEWKNDIKTAIDSCNQKSKFYEQQSHKIAKEKAKTAMSLIGQKYASLKKDRGSVDPEEGDGSNPGTPEGTRFRNFSYHKMGSLDKIKAAQIAQEKLDQMKEEERKEQEEVEKRSIARAKKAKEILSKQYSLKRSTSSEDPNKQADSNPPQ